MKTHFSNQYNSYHLHQTGIVLFIALIALVVMSLAAVALIRSVDTNSQITGNLAFRQTSIISSSYGVESIADTLGGLRYEDGFANGAGAGVAGYYATCNTFDTLLPPSRPCSGNRLTLDATWVPGASSTLANGIGMAANGRDQYGNTIEYIVERMCTAVGAPSLNNCLFEGQLDDTSSKTVLRLDQTGAPEVTTDVPVYRVTVRIQGPKNTVSYIQSFIS
jgi:type IV pilus assembly protein PilX